MNVRTRCIRRMSGLFCAALIVCGVIAIPMGAQTGNSLPAAWTHWKYFRAIDLPATNAPRLAILRVPTAILAHGQSDLADLRVIDDRGQEVPYVLRVAYGSQRTRALVAQQLELSYVPHKYTQVALHISPMSPFHNSVRITTPLTNFIAWVRVEISDDAREWRHTGSTQPIYCLPNRGVVCSETVNYPETNARYIRLRIYSNEEKFPIYRADVLYSVAVPEEDENFAVTGAASEENQKTVWRADLGADVPVDAVSIESSTAEFYRYAQVFLSGDPSDGGQDWTMAGSGEFYRFRAAPPEEAASTSADSSSSDELQKSQRISFTEHAARYWKIEVLNNNDAPLSNVKLQLSMAARNVVFRQEPSRAYSLLYGQSEITTSPEYDLAHVLSETQIRAAQPASLIAEEKVNASWSDPRPWSDRNSIVLWIAVILAALVLAVVALQSLRAASPNDANKRSDS